jgi:cobyrinic acid a,c-diamide synthase
MTDRLVIAGTHSGVGKTTVATGLMAALTARGERVAGFKVGPDFVDPSYHRLATGRPGRNLDAFLCGDGRLPGLFAHGAAGSDVAVVEGVMGLFDGSTGADDTASTAHVARLLNAPVVLVVDASAMARSVAAVVHGYASFDSRLRLAGVVVNRVASPRHAELLAEALASLEVTLLGTLRREDSVANPSRHLGLIPAAERRPEALGAVATIGERVSEACDLAALRRTAAAAGPISVPPWRPRDEVSPPTPDSPPVRVAVAAGQAFSFAYPEHGELLEASGAELAELDPVADVHLPQGTEALVLGGGFPEAYAEALSANACLRAEIAAFADAGGPIVAECGGMLYLSQSLDGWPMCGVLPAAARMGDRLSLGYRQATAVTDSPLWRGGDEVSGHEFHYSHLEPPVGETEDARVAWRWPAAPRGESAAPGQTGPALEGFVRDQVHASYLHTHWAATPQAPSRLVAEAQARRRPPAGV